MPEKQLNLKILATSHWNEQKPRGYDEYMAILENEVDKNFIALKDFDIEVYYS